MKSIFSNFNLRPINKTAGLVTSEGFEFKPIKEFENCFKDIPPIEFCDSDFIGTSVGRLTVIGRHKKDAGRKTKWVCRCSCGNYLITKSKRINDAKKDKILEDRAMCNECDYLIYIRSNRAASTPISKTNKALKKLNREKK